MLTLDNFSAILYLYVQATNRLDMTTCKSILHNCLYFTANSLSRVITRMAEEEFRKTGLSPSHAFMMMLVTDNPGVCQKELCERLYLAPSTITRFIDTLVYKGYVSRQSEGKTSKVYPTEKGKQLRKPIDNAWKNLYQRYAKVLGSEEGNKLTTLIDKAAEKLTNSTR